MKILKGIKAKATISTAEEIPKEGLTKQALQATVDAAKEASLDLEIQVTGVKPTAPNTYQISFVIKGEYEAAADFAAYADSVIRNLLEKASAKDASKLPLEKIQKIKTT